MGGSLGLAASSPPRMPARSAGGGVADSEPLPHYRERGRAGLDIGEDLRRRRKCPAVKVSDARRFDPACLRLDVLSQRRRSRRLPQRSWRADNGAPFRRRGIRSARRTRRTVDALTRWPSLSSSPWIRWYPQPWFSVAGRPMSAVISVLTGGRPLRCG
jgi:hypothetical protein